MLGILDPGKRMAEYIRDILLHDREALKGHHIDTAFNSFPQGHCIRALFVRAALRLFMLHHSPDMSRDIDHQVVIDSALGPARINALYGDQFIYQSQVDKFPDFETRLLKEQNLALKTRVVTTSNSGKTSWVHYRDPLTDQMFVSNPTCPPALYGSRTMLSKA